MKKTFFVIAAFAVLAYTSCEVADVINPWTLVPECNDPIPQMDFVGSIDCGCVANPTLPVGLHINDVLFPDFGKSDYFLDLQYRDANNQLVCVMLPELAPFRFMLQPDQVRDSRFKVRRLTYSEEGVLWQRVESNFYFFTNGILQP